MFIDFLRAGGDVIPRTSPDAHFPPLPHHHNTSPPRHPQRQPHPSKKTRIPDLTAHPTQNPLRQRNTVCPSIMVKCPDCGAGADLTKDGSYAHCASCTYLSFFPFCSCWGLLGFGGLEDGVGNAEGDEGILHAHKVWQENGGTT